jgi:hypothetical protein
LYLDSLGYFDFGYFDLRGDVDSRGGPSVPPTDRSNDTPCFPAVQHNFALPRFAPARARRGAYRSAPDPALRDL